jgi:DNA-binding CsgD family transcriptional regulator
MSACGLGVPQPVTGSQPGVALYPAIVWPGNTGVLLPSRTPASRISFTPCGPVAAGEAFLSPAVTSQLLDHVARRLPAAVDRHPEQLAALTERELAVLRMLAAGLSNSEIASALVLSEATVKTHVSKVLQKLALRDRVQAAIIAYETGLVEPGTRSS